MSKNKALNSDDLLERKQYLCGVTIIEGRNLVGQDASGTSDPFIIVKCAGQAQQTQKKYEVNSATWNQTLTFPGIMMNQYELETLELNIECYDHNALLANELIGKYSIGLSSLYRNLNHEFYKVWVGLFREENPNKVQGYLQLSCYIIGPNEKPPVHAQDEDFGDDDGVNSDQDPEELARMVESIKRAQGVTQILNPSKIDKSYQLNVVVAQAQGLPIVDSSKKVKPFVSARVFGCVLTTNVRPNANPKFNAKLQFPIYYPVLNDKITMRIWSKKGGLSSNVFIANIPEHPGPSDYFNLTKIMASDGRMPARWINLYGTLPMERNSRTKGRKEGSSYLGRILIAFNMTSNEKPQLNQGQANAIKEPKIRHYQLWVDLYSLIKCDIIEEGAPVWAQISIGNYRTKDPIIAKYKPKKRAYVWKKVSVDALEDLQLPHDFNQIPDIFIDLFTTTFSGEERFGYLRIDPKMCISKKPKPNWFRLKSPYNDTGNTNIGLLMCNIQFLRFDPTGVYKPERVVKKKEGKQQYKFYYQILSGFELASVIPENKLNCRVELTIGNLSVDTGNLKTSYMKGRYPVWNHFDSKDVMLEKELTFESDMRVTVQNQKTGLFGSLSNQIIGEFAVPVQSMLKQSEKPQFFKVLNEEGQFMGQVLANFFLKIFVRDPKTRKIKGYVDPEHIRIQDEFKEILHPTFRISVEFAIVGIRNLIKKAIRPRITIRLTNNPEAEHIIKIDEKWKENMNCLETSNPNFGQIIKFEDVPLPKEPLCWPFIEVQVVDEEREEAFIALGGCEDCFTTISLVDFAQQILSEQDVMYAQAQLSRNQDSLTMIQPQINTKDFMKEIGAIIEQKDLNFGNLVSPVDPNGDTGEPGMYEMRGTMRPTMMNNGVAMNVLDEKNKDARGQGTINLFKTIGTVDYDDLDISIMMKGGGDHGMDGGGGNFDFGDSEEEDPNALNPDEGGKGGQANDLENGIIIDTDNVFELYVTPGDKAKEDRTRQKKIVTNEAMRKAFLKKLKSLPPDDKIKKDKVKLKMMSITDEMEDLREEEMTEQKFWGLLALNDDDDTFDYGRDVLKEGTYETVMTLPYQQLPLFTKNDWFADSIQKPIVQVGGILRSGNLSGASIKGLIKVTDLDEGDDSEDQNSNGSARSSQKNEGKDKKAAAAPPPDDQTGNTNKAEKYLAVCTEIHEAFPFEITRPEYLDKLNNDPQLYAVRVYLISAQNLTATGTVIDLKSRIAGMTALSTANPYPILTVGDGITPPESKIKKINDRERSMDGELNPCFFRTYELYANFPEDWKLELSIMDKGAFESMDNLIGSTTIDLENRHYSNLLWLDRHALVLEQNKNKQDLGSLKKEKTQAYRNANKALKARKDFINRTKMRIKEIEQILIPIEYRELIHPSKTQAQGMAEMWVEVITWEESKKIIPQKMQTVHREKYEIRVIVWETRDVPLIDGDNVDIYVRCIWDPTGWTDDEEEKKTDIHHNSKTGWGHFNWRFKFDMEVPLDFPRIKFIIHDSGVFSDEAVGQATLNLKNTISKLSKEGFVEVPKTYITCWHPNKPGEERGVLMFSMTILTKEEADADPVGESWDEPNHSPFLKKPTAGRGFGEALNLGGWSLDLSWNPFGKFLPFLIVTFVIMLLLTYFMYYRMFTA